MMVTIQAAKRALGVCLLLLLIASCSREQQDWRSAEAADTLESYDQFIQRHPESELTTQARMRVAQLGEDRDWQRAGSADSADAYRQFIAQHPNGKWAQEARIRLDNFSLAQSSAGAGADGVGAVAGAGPGTGSGVGAAAGVGSGTSSGVGAAAGAAPGAGAGGDFGIQLGAFASEASATSQWRMLSGQFGAELQGLSERVVPADTASGRLYRLQAMVGDEARARAICEALRRRSQGCVPVLPH